MSSEVTTFALSAPQNVRDLLSRLHKLSLDQERALEAPDGEYHTLRDLQKSDPEQAKSKRDEVMQDKFIALEEDRSCFVYNMIRATGALNVVEAGTSFGVSTIYLALAVGQNAKLAGKEPGAAKVIATENEPAKASKARKHWKEAGDTVQPWIELREGDLTQTLKTDMPTIDFVLFDIWTPMVVPTLDVLEPHFQAGAVLVCDNTTASAQGYQPFFDRIKAPGSRYRTLTLPFKGGLELVTYWPEV